MAPTKIGPMASVYISASTMADLDKIKPSHASGSIFGHSAVTIRRRVGTGGRLGTAPPGTQ